MPTPIENFPFFRAPTNQIFQIFSRHMPTNCLLAEALSQNLIGAKTTP